MSQKEKYLEEYEKYKHIELSYGFWFLKKQPFIVYDMYLIEDDIVYLRQTATENCFTKTPHWCRKNLQKKVSPPVEQEVKNEQEDQEG